MGKLVLRSKHRLLCGDCRDPAAWERLLGGERVDLLLTDPPYGISYVHGEGGGCLASSTRFAGKQIVGDDKPFDPTRWISFPSVVLWGANHYADKLPGMSGWMIWDKRDGMASNDQADCEIAWTNSRSPARLFSCKWNGMIRDGDGEKAPRIHPTQKPVALMAWCIELCGDAKLIADPFVGSGTTIMACEALGRRCFACEIEPAYVDASIRRWQAKTGEQARLESTGETFAEREAANG